MPVDSLRRTSSLPPWVECFRVEPPGGGVISPTGRPAMNQAQKDLLALIQISELLRESGMDWCVDAPEIVLEVATIVRATGRVVEPKDG